MKISLNLYDALTAISVPKDKAKAVVDAWEDDVKNLASKSDLQQTEAHLKISISELGAAIREQGVALNAAINIQGVELRSLIERQSKEFQGSISKLEANNTLLRWQFGILVLCFGIPILKDLYMLYW